MTDDKDWFSHLAIGLVEFSRHGFRAEPPDVLRHALGWFSMRLIQSARPLPSSLIGMLKLLEQPSVDWWPGSSDDLPDWLDPNLPMIWDAFDLAQGDHAPHAVIHEQVLEHIVDLQGDGRPLSGLSGYVIQAAIDAKHVEKWVNAMRERARSQPAFAEEYTVIRSFLIRHPYTTHDELREGLRGLAWPQHDVISMYETVDSIQNLRHEGAFWTCPHCRGVLVWMNGRPRCAKPSLCEELYPSYQGRQAVDPAHVQLRLKWAVHTRLCLPGLAELALFKQLDQLRIESSNLLTVSLWPGVDVYDLRVIFKDGSAWAVDVKDYTNPKSLGRKLTGVPVGDDEPTRWDKAFYVIPDYRQRLMPGYMTSVRKHLDPSIKVLIESDFVSLVNKTAR